MGLQSAATSAYLVPVGRLLFAAIFLLAAPGHFGAGAIEHAAGAGVPAANLLVPLTGVMLLVGGLSVLLGYHARIGAVVLLAFLLPVTFTMHQFWNVADPQMAQMEQAAFMKNLGLMGAAILIAYFGAGPYSLDLRRERPGR
jgi:putative oxidoreductase